MNLSSLSDKSDNGNNNNDNNDDEDEGNSSQLQYATYLKWVQENDMLEHERRKVESLKVDLLCFQERCGILTEKLDEVTTERDRYVMLLVAANNAAIQINTNKELLTRKNNEINQLTQQNEVLNQQCALLEGMNDKMGDQMDYLMTEISRLRKNKGINHGRISMMKNINVDISHSTSSIVESLSDGDDDDIYENDDDYDDDDSYDDTTASNDNDEEDTSLTKKDSEGGTTGDLQYAISAYDPHVDIERERGSPIDVMTQTEHRTEKPTSDGLHITNKLKEEAAPINQLNEATPMNSTLAVMKVYKSIRSRHNMTLHHVQQYQRYVDRRARMVHQQRQKYTQTVDNHC